MVLSPKITPLRVMRPPVYLPGLHLLALVFLIGFSYTKLEAAVPREYMVQVEATVTESPAAIKLKWPLEPDATSYEISRKLRPEITWTVLASVPGTATEWTDSSVTVGTQYEYKVKRPAIHGAVFDGYGYINAGIRVAPIDHRGTVILLVDDSMSAPLSAELARLNADLVGDGWSVIRHDVSRSDTVAAVKSLIVADHAANPGEVRSVFLFGHLPVPYAGNYAYDGHSPEHQGAWAADLYYGDVDGIWTDSTVNNPNGHYFPENDNVPGDGKFDQFQMTSGIDLEVGRVDLSHMPAFAKNETELLRQYLDKDHAHRHALRVLPKRALIEDHHGEFNGEAFAVSGWRAGTALAGAANITQGSFGTLSTEAYLFYYVGGGGWVDSCDAIHTSDFASSDPQAAFTLLFGSWFGDWDKPNNFLRAPLATTTGLTSAWSGRPHWFLHTMAMGGTTGEAARLTQNNRGAESIYIIRNVTAGTHVALMGDPTLRLTAAVPPTGITVTPDGNNQASLSWTASPDATLGYYVYRSENAQGPFIRLTADPIPATGWTDASASNGTFFYQVKAVKLETTPGGTYTNTSQAIAGAVTLSGSGAQAGLRAEYFTNQSLTPPVALTRVDDTIDFDWGNGSPDPSIPNNGFSVRWTGQVQAQVSETYTFHITSDDGARLWINNIPVIDKWIEQGPTEWSGSLPLLAGRKYNVRLEYYESGGGAAAHFSWSSPSTPQSVVPQTQLSSLTTAVTYASWAQDHQLAGDDALPESDPDANGINNLTEYAFGIWHASPDKSRLPGVGIVADNLTVTYRPIQSDVHYQPEWSTGLSVWSTAGFTLIPSGETVTAQVPIGSDGKKFIRLKLVK